jgi:hypothetical protein
MGVFPAGAESRLRFAARPHLAAGLSALVACRYEVALARRERAA